MSYQEKVQGIKDLYLLYRKSEDGLPGTVPDQVIQELLKILETILTQNISSKETNLSGLDDWERWAINQWLNSKHRRIPSEN